MNNNDMTRRPNGSWKYALLKDRIYWVFWGLSFYVLLNIFSPSSDFQPVDIIYTVIFLLTLAIPVHINLHLLVPLLLKEGKYLPWSAGFFVLLFVFAWLNQLVFNHLVDYLFPNYYFISYYTYGDLLKFFLVFLGLTTLIQLSKEWFVLNRDRQRVLRLEKEKVDAELKALANQVNPHFLFNSLNVIYSLAVNGRRESPEAILKLSDILRHVIYDSAADRVELEKEVALIQNYIDLQRFRVGSEARITFVAEGEGRGLTLAPMLLLPLVENGFKHGIKGDVSNTFLDIQLRVEGSDLTFRVENNKGEPGGGDAAYTPGVGLENIRNRLELIYPGRHQLVIEDRAKSYRVELGIRRLEGLEQG